MLLTRLAGLAVAVVILAALLGAGTRLFSGNRDIVGAARGAGIAATAKASRPIVVPSLRSIPSPRTTPPGARRSAKPPVAATTVSPEAREVLRLTNAQRVRAGCEPLTLSGDLQQAAQSHSEWQSRHGMGHVGADGTRPGDRATAAGYGWSRIGENVAAGYDSAAAVVTGWMNSSGHRKNVLTCSFRHLGVGMARHDNTVFWTQLFGA